MHINLAVKKVMYKTIKSCKIPIHAFFTLHIHISMIAKNISNTLAPPPPLSNTNTHGKAVIAT